MCGSTQLYTLLPCNGRTRAAISCDIKRSGTATCSPAVLSARETALCEVKSVRHIFTLHNTTFFCVCQAVFGKKTIKSLRAKQTGNVTVI